MNPSVPISVHARGSTSRFVLAALVLSLLPAATTAKEPTTADPPTPPPPITSAEYAARRARVLEALDAKGDGAVLLLRAPPRQTFASDVHYPYRPNNDLYYLTGVTHHRCALLLCANDWSGLGRELLFLRPTSEFAKRWTGEGWSAERAGQVSGLATDAIQPLDKLVSTLSTLGPTTMPHGHPPLGGSAARRPFFFDTGGTFTPGEAPSEPYGFLLAALGSEAFHLALAPPRELLRPLRRIKSDAELALVRKAIDATGVALEEAMRTLRPGLVESQVAARIHAAFVEESCRGWAFPSIVGSGPNSCILHYESGERRLEAGDVVLLDVGGEYGFYAADISRTLPVSGTFSPRQRAIYELVLAAQTAAIRSVRPDQTMTGIHEVAAKELSRGLIELGLIEDESELRKYYPHRTCHGLGLDVHDSLGGDTPLEPGMILTVEPGLYIEEEELGIRIEDDVLVTVGGAVVLSERVPRTVEAIEAAMRASR